MSRGKAMARFLRDGRTRMVQRFNVPGSSKLIS
jgi:hypothetical protein